MIMDSATSATPKTMESPNQKAQSSKLPANGSPNRDDKELTFKPDLVSSPDLREKVRSSNYGKAVPVLVEKPKVPTDLELEEEKELTFKPDLSISAKTRTAVTSSGYGKVVPEPKEKKVEPKPSFKPVIAATKRFTKKATSSGYGQVTPQKKHIDPKLYIPSFKPKMDFGRKSQKLRSATQARLLEPPRPRTAPADGRKQPAPLLHTLAADSAPPEAPRSESVGPGFDLSGLQLLGKLPPTIDPSPLGKMPDPITPTSAGQKLKESAAASGYGSSWTPPVVPVAVKESLPPVRAGAVTTYIDSPVDIPVVKSKSIASAVPHYGEDYVVPVAMKPAHSPPPPTFFPPKNVELAGIDDIPVVDNSKKNKSAVAAYGKDYSPPKAQLPEKKDPPVANFVTYSEGMPELDEIVPVKNKLDYVASSGYGVVSTHTPEYNPRLLHAQMSDGSYQQHQSPAESKSSYPDEQTTIL